MRLMNSYASPLLLGLLAACLVPQSSMRTGGNANSGQEHNLLANSTFEGGKSVPWTSSFTAPSKGDVSVQDGALCLRIDDKGENNWDAQLRHREMVIMRGRSYTVSFRAWASAPTMARPKVGMAGPPYAEYWADTIELGTEPRSFRASFMMKGKDDPTAEFAFHLGGSLAKSAPLTICLDDVVLSDPEFVSERRAEVVATHKLVANQVGYLPTRAKIAVLVEDSKEPVEFQLRDARGSAVYTGKSTPHGADAASGQHVHILDFSSFSSEGDGYVVEARGEKSDPFAIRANVYRDLKYDALAYFYHNRSGIEITLPYAREKQWTRPAGHLHDNAVGCAPKAGCNHTLDVSGGWYDAGDHGKYVVNGGISVWTMLNQYERLSVVGGSSKLDFADGKLAIPEQKNGKPDLLDEARWELEFLLKMQIPSGSQAGLVHHKMHDSEWTALPLAPHMDKMKRLLYAPSTAATLNLAAVAAQAARIYQPIDAPFAQRCLAAAERAYAAARKQPALFAPTGGVGGGPYDDTRVEDEFYWAAAELLVTTGKQSYREAVVGSPFHAKVTAQDAAGMGGESAMTWQNTESLGTLAIALVGGKAGEAEQRAAREAVSHAAEHYLGRVAELGYRVPLAPSSSGYPWGSNGSVLNNMVVLALAYDFTQDARFADGVLAGMNYLLGVNPLGLSYVTGYGERPIKNPHHRFWAHQADRGYPPPPPGCVSGGPNSGLEDPYARGMGLQGCAPQTCYVDHIESFATNEITINWNAPLAWIAAFLDEVAQRGI
jgi:endoglucanase